MLKMMRVLSVDFRRNLPLVSSQPPLYLSWSSQLVGYPVPGLVSTLFHHMYSAPLRSVQMFLQAMLHVWQPMHLSRWKTIEICMRTSMGDSSIPEGAGLSPAEPAPSNFPSEEKNCLRPLAPGLKASPFLPRPTTSTRAACAPGCGCRD